MTTDTFDFGGIQVKNQPFLEATTMEPLGLSWDDISIIRGIAGLTPSSADSVLYNSSPFISMVDGKVLDRYLFSLRLREPRELIVGAIDHEQFTGDLVKIPLTKKTGRYALTGRKPRVCYETELPIVFACSVVCNLWIYWIQTVCQYDVGAPITYI